MTSSSNGSSSSNTEVLRWIVRNYAPIRDAPYHLWVAQATERNRGEPPGVVFVYTLQLVSKPSVPLSEKMLEFQFRGDLAQRLEMAKRLEAADTKETLQELTDNMGLIKFKKEVYVRKNVPAEALVDKKEFDAMDNKTECCIVLQLAGRPSERFQCLVRCDKQPPAHKLWKELMDKELQLCQYCGETAATTRQLEPCTGCDTVLYCRGTDHRALDADKHRAVCSSALRTLVCNDFVDRLLFSKPPNELAHIRKTRAN